MAVYRIHRKTWDKGFPRPSAAAAAPTTKKRPSANMDGDEADDDEVVSVQKSQFPGGGRKGISSGLSVVVKHKEGKTKSGWWKELGDAPRSRAVHS